MNFMVVMSNRILTNSKWDDASPCFSIITPIFNRSETMKRTIASVESQLYRDFEYIMIDDGSTDDIDSVVIPFLNSTDIPVMYVKKDNGGVHTARNIGLANARGHYYIELDSDDELTSNALQVFFDTWNLEEVKNNPLCREIVAQCVNEKGERCGSPFPGDINEMSSKEAHKVCGIVNGEHIGCSLASIRKRYPYPEPNGVTFYTESILWALMDKEYSSYYINDTLRVYHSEGDDHLNTMLDKTRKKKSLQSCRNGLWECSYILNKWKEYKDSGFCYFENLVRYSVMRHVLKRRRDCFVSENNLTGVRNKFLYGCLFPLTFLVSLKYEKDRM